MDQDDEERPVAVPYTALSPETLRAVAEDFCTRDGTDYGEVELTLNERVVLLMGQLARGEARILFEATTETLRIVTSDEASALPCEAGCMAGEVEIVGDIEGPVVPAKQWKALR